MSDETGTTTDARDEPVHGAGAVPETHQERFERLQEEAKSFTNVGYENLIEQNSVTWSDIVEVKYAADGDARDGSLPDDDLAALRQIVDGIYFWKLADEYATRYGGIEARYFTKHVIGSAVFTKRGQFDFALNTDEILDGFSGSKEQWELLIAAVGALTESFTEIEDIYRLARSVTRSTDADPERSRARQRDLFLHRVALDLYSLSTVVLAEADRLHQLVHAERTEPDDQWEVLVNMGRTTSLQTLPPQLTSVRERVETEKKRRAIAPYITGLAVGAVILPAVMVAIFVFTALTPTDSGVFLLVVTAASGAVGAAVSVMLRVSRSSLEVGEDQQRWVLFLSGMFRPILGAVFGIAFYVLTVGGLLPLDVPQDTTKAAFFFAGVAFLAGFSEQLAQDVFVRTGRGLGGGSSESREQPGKDS